MKPRINFNFLLALAVAFMGGYALYVSNEWPFRTAFFPRMIAISLLLLALIEMALSVFGTEKEREGHAVDFELTTDIDSLVARRRTLTIIVWILGFFALILSVGFPLGVPVFVFLYLKWAGKERWGLTLLLTILSWLLIKGLFDWLLHLPFPPGWIFSLLGY